jgi:formate-dependent phosphoribosylglycinamide formyltransferase (GAR transformylase)
MGGGTVTRLEGLLVFVGPGMTSFEQVAASANRRGIATAWIGYPFSWAGRARVRCFVPEVGSADSVPGLVRELRRLGPERIRDIQTSEYYLVDVAEAARLAGVPDAVVRDLTRRQRLADKLEASRVLAAAGVPVPQALDAEWVSPEEAVDELGLPLVVKGRVASGGTGVYFADSLAQVEHALTRVVPYGGAMYEAFVKGESFSYAAAYRDDGTILSDAAYLTMRVGHDVSAPPDRIVLLDDPDVVAVGRGVVRSVGGYGLVNVNVIRDADGVPWVHDVNLRPWGTIFALRAAGLDFVADYAALLGLASAVAQPDPGLLAVGKQFDVFPSAALGVADTDLVAASVLFAGQLRQYVRWTGLDYVLAETARSALIVGRSWWRRRVGYQVRTGS